MVQIYTGGYVVGTVEGTVFSKSVRASKHQLRKPPAWCLSVESIEEAESAGAREVQLTDRESGTVYRASLDCIFKNGKRMERGGFEPQIQLELRFWQKFKPNKDRDSGRLTKEPEPLPALAEQLALF